MSKTKIITEAVVSTMLFLGFVLSGVDGDINNMIFYGGLFYMARDVFRSEGKL
jgi:hypothetical protein